MTQSVISTFPVLTLPEARVQLTRNFGEETVPASMLERNEQMFGEPLTPDQVVDRILQDVKTRGDEAIREWTRKFDRVLVETLEQAFELNNIYAPEHLCLLIQNPWDHLGAVESAGGIFVGEDSMEALGDYLAGPSHVMPTGGTARFSSPLNVRDFQKIISVVGLNRQTLQATGPAAARIARAEGLEAHARAIEIRLKD